jgi:hypothetical protein
MRPRPGERTTHSLNTKPRTGASSTQSLALESNAALVIAAAMMPSLAGANSDPRALRKARTYSATLAWWRLRAVRFRECFEGGIEGYRGVCFNHYILICHAKSPRWG